MGERDPVEEWAVIFGRGNRELIDAELGRLAEGGGPLDGGAGGMDFGDFYPSFEEKSGGKFFKELGVLGGGGGV